MTGVVRLDLAALPDEAPGGEDIHATLEVLGDGWFHAQRGVPEGQSAAGDDRLQPGQARVSYAARQPLDDVGSDNALAAP